MEKLKRKRKRVWIPGPRPDYRNVARGTEWLKRIREGLDRGQSADDVIEEMLRKDKRP